MVGRLAKAASLLLIGWIAFVAGAVVYARACVRSLPPPAADADEIDLVASFGELRHESTAAVFRGGRVTAWFAGGVVDLHRARLDPAGATIRTQTVFGGGNLVVPADWRVEVAVVTVLGGIGDARPGGGAEPGAPTLRLEGVALFGGWGITTAPVDEAPADRAPVDEAPADGTAAAGAPAQAGSLRPGQAVAGTGS
jgi:hypothetical protein